MTNQKEKSPTIQEPTKAPRIVEPINNISNVLYNEPGGQNKPFLFNCIVDNKVYTVKPTGYEIGLISNRLSKGQELKLSIDEFKAELEKGKTYLSGYIKDKSIGRKKNNIININFFSLDVDNHYQEDNKDIYTNYTIQEATNKVESLLNIKPILSYVTFTRENTNGSKRFRLVYAINGLIDSKGINNLLKYISLNSGDLFDKSAVDESRMFFSTDQEVITYNNYKPLNHQVVDKLKVQAKQEGIKEKIKLNKNINYKGDNEIEELKNQDLGEYLENQGYQVKSYSEGYKLPCPIHKGTNDNFIINYKNNNWVYKCQSKCKLQGKEGGTIIDLHKELNNLETGEAIKELKEMYNIKNDYAVTILKEDTEVVEVKKDNRPDSLYNYMSDKFIKDIDSYKEFKDRKTGFKNLDEITSLYPGLYVIGGLSTLGKTTFIHQMTDQMAEQGEHILFFSLEMATLELMTKSIARLSVLNEKGYNFENGVSSLQVRLNDIPNEKRAIVQKAITDYEPISKRFNIIEGNFNTNISTIKNYVKDYIEGNKVKPIIVIDYLQIIPGDESSFNNKDKIDQIVTGLKQMSRDYNITVIVVSSLNRSNYLTPIDFESFKESGGIEYTADVVWGLQLQAIHDDIFNSSQKIKEKREIITEAKKSNPRKIELVCLKNRTGISNYSCNFTYYPKYDLFISDDKTEDYSITWNNTTTRRL